MTKFVVDSWAWIEYLDGSQRGELVREMIEDDRHDVYAASASLAEVISKFIRKGKDKSIAINAIARLAKVVSIDEELAELTGEVHAEFKRRIPNFSLGEAFVLATANKLGARVVTGDPDFKTVKGVVLI